MFVLGVDPGLSRCGYGVVEVVSARGAKARSAGVIRTSPSTPLPQRLAELQAEVRSLLSEFRPDTVAVERVFFQRNVRTAMAVGHASGVVMAEGASHGCHVAEYTPNEVKNAVTGYGAASKDQMERMVQVRLGLDQPLRPVDAADALAVALCHLAHRSPLTAARR